VIRFLHISDRHWHSSNERNDTQLRLQEALDSRFRDHILIETGDITDDGHQAQYERVREAMESWRGRWFFCPGNHDYGIAGNFYDSVRALRFDEMLSEPFSQGGVFSGINAPVVNMIEDETDRVMLIALDSNLETPSPWDFACGEIGNHQLKPLSRILKDVPRDVIKIVFMHHHPWIHWDPFMKLLDAQSLLMRLRGRINVLLFGHRHKAGIWKGKWNIQLAIAAPRSPEVPWVREIVVDNGEIIINRLSWRESNHEKEPVF